MIDKDSRMAKAEERLMEWLRDAHAAEEQAETMLSRFAERLDHYPELKARIREHVTETKRQAEKVKKCIERRNGSASVLKVASAKAVGLGQALSGIFVGDEVLKGTLASRAFEAMEIASYQILVKAAQQVGDSETATVCTQILREEQAMAKWLDDHIDGLTAKYLQREDAGVIAKH
jgi:ferritin-like metal-binding protein YciE